MLKTIKNDKDLAIIKRINAKYNKESWGDCSDSSLLKRLERPETDKINKIRFKDVDGLADELHIYFK